MVDLSIIVINYNTKDITKKCIDSIIKKNHDVSYEIILVDNASMDDSCEYLHKCFPEIKLISNNENLGFAKANNQGIRMSKGRYILLLNSDTIVLEDCLKKIIDFAVSRPDAGIIGCKVLNRDMTLQYSCYRNPTFLSEFIFFTKCIIKDTQDPITYHKYMKYWSHNFMKAVDCVSGCFMMIRKDIFDNVGCLDESFFMYYEDSDFCRRVKSAGFKVIYYPNSQIIHLHGLSGDKTNFATLKQCFGSACFYINKYYGKYVSTIFRTLCLLIFRMERLVFSIFSHNDKCAKKEKMLKSIIG